MNSGAAQYVFSSENVKVSPEETFSFITWVNTEMKTNDYHEINSLLYMYNHSAYKKKLV